MVTASEPALAPAGIYAQALDELWIHTGTACNLDCPFCLEGSKPGDSRLQRVTLHDVKPLLDEAVRLGVRRFGFTGGEPFVVKDMVAILEYAANLRPCLVLTNGTAPVVRRLWQLKRLRDTAQTVSFRISIDYPDEARHDAGRGAGNFRLAWAGLKALHRLGLPIAIAYQAEATESGANTLREFAALLAGADLPEDTPLLPLPDYGPPGSRHATPLITEHAIAALPRTELARKFLCARSRMAVKTAGRMQIYACPLVDDDPGFDLGSSLADALAARVLLTHHRCYSCTRFGAAFSG